MNTVTEQTPVTSNRVEAFPTDNVKYSEGNLRVIQLKGRSVIMIDTKPYHEYAL